MSTVGDWTTVRCITVGTGNLALSTRLDGFAGFKDTIPAGLVWYSVSDANGNKETGEGTYDGDSIIARTSIHATLFNGVYNGASPSPISLTGESVVSCTMNAKALNDITNSIIDMQSNIDTNIDNISTNSNNIAINAVDIANNTTNIDTNIIDIETNTDNIAINAIGIAINEVDILLREVAITSMELIGTVSGGVSQAGDTSIFIEEGVGEVIDSYTDPTSPTIIDVSWTDTTFDLLINAGMPVPTGLGYTEVGVDANGAFIVYPNGASRSQRKVAILLAGIYYIDRVISSIKFAPIVSNQTGNLFHDLFEFLDLSNLINGLVTRPTTIGDMTVWRDSGELIQPGINYITSLLDQNVIQISAAGSEILGLFFNLTSYNNGNTSLGAYTDQVPSTAYEPDGAGVIEQLAANKVTIHYLYQLIGVSIPTFFLSYGQKEYDTHADAVTNLFADKSTHLVPSEFESTLLLCQMVVNKDAITWGIEADIFPINSSSSSGSSGGSATSAVNISYSDSFNIGNNVQSAIDSLAIVKLTPNQNDAIDSANAPTAANPLATIDDLLAFEPADPAISKTDIAETRTASINMGDNQLTRSLLRDTSEVASLVGNFGVAYDFDMEVSNVFTGTVNQNVTFTFSNPIAVGATFFMLEISNGGSFNISWPNETKWEGGIEPSLTVIGIDILGFYTSNGGTTWNGFVGSLDSR